MITGGVASEPRDRPHIPGFVLLGLILAVIILDSQVSLREQFFLGGLIAVQAYGLQFAWRYCGVFSLAYTAISGIGGYTALLVAMHFAMPFWQGALLALPITVAVGALIGLLGVRTSGMHFVMLTYALTGLLEVLGDNGGAFTGGTNGLTLVQPTDLGFMTLGINSELGANILMYILLISGVATVVLPRFSKIGKRLIASRDNHQLARGLGIRATRERIIALAFSGVLSSLAGSLYAFHEFHVEPDLFGATAGLQVLVALVLGGMNTWSGPIFGAALTTSLPQYLGLSPLITQITYGMILIVIVMAIPGGVSAIGKRLASLMPQRMIATTRAPLDIGGPEIQRELSDVD
jgi:branched-chain amino acid transport system permease protein